jgi:[ribosomal protein S5]-alanine N-acetyltransferase
MSDAHIQTRRLSLVSKTLAEVRAEIAGMDAELRGQLSSDWLAQLDAPTVDLWTLGFTIVHRATDSVVGGCGFKGRPGSDGIVEIAYGIAPEQQGKGYATEAAAALVAFAFDSSEVRIVRAHTFSDVNASARVLTKCGFLSVGQVIDPEDGVVWRWETARAPA